MLPAQVEQGEVMIEEGLQPGERVVVEGQYKLQQGSRVKLADAAGEVRRPKARRPKESPKRRRPKQGARAQRNLTPSTA